MTGMRSTPPAPSAADLAATVRDVLSGRLGTHEAVVGAMDALDALLARCQEAERDAGNIRAAYLNLDEVVGEWRNRAEAAERERDEMESQVRALDSASAYLALTRVEEVQRRCDVAEARVEELEAAIREWSESEIEATHYHIRDPHCPHCIASDNLRDALQSGGSDG